MRIEIIPAQAKCKRIMHITLAHYELIGLLSAVQADRGMQLEASDGDTQIIITSCLDEPGYLRVVTDPAMGWNACRAGMKE